MLPPRPFGALGKQINHLGALAFRYYGRAPGVDSLRADLPRFYAVLEFRWMDTLYGWLVGAVQRRRHPCRLHPTVS